MEHEIEYDPVSGIEVDVCKMCEELTNNFRAQVAYLRRYDDFFRCHDGSDYDDVRANLG